MKTTKRTPNDRRDFTYLGPRDRAFTVRFHRLERRGVSRTAAARAAQASLYGRDDLGWSIRIYPALRAGIKPAFGPVTTLRSFLDERRARAAR